MKTIAFLLTVLSALLQIMVAQMPGQPDYVGLSQYDSGGPYVVPYGTLFEPSGKFFLTVRHTAFDQNHQLTFGNGQTRRVRRISYFSQSANSYDIVVGELDKAVTGVTIPQVWWQMPQDLVQNKIDITGFSYLDGWFTGSKGYIDFLSPVENGRDFRYLQPSTGEGYSGAPIFYQGKLFGFHSGSWSDPNDPTRSGGSAVPLFLLMQDYWNKFPAGIISTPPKSPSLEVRQVGSMIEVILKSSAGNRLQVTTSDNLSQWIPVYEKSGFIESVPLSQWETVVRWNLAGQEKSFFNTFTRRE